MSTSAPQSTDNLSTWLDYWTTVHVTAIDLGLERVQPVAHALDILQPEATVFTVAGTNGKGSTTATIAEIMSAAGYKVGLYQSPHIYRFNERVMIDRQQVDDRQLIDAFVAVEQARQQCRLTLSFFEATTLAAMWLFKQQHCDVWVLEVGLGGRLDVVNIIDPDVAVITNIGLDHTDWLGNSIEKIAYEKAGIIRNDIPVIFAGDQDLPQAIADKVQACHAQLWQYQKDYFFQQDEQNLYLAYAADTLCLPLGHLAAINQAAAVMAVIAAPLAVSQTAIAQGLRQARLPGRFEICHYHDRTVILDVAHNPHGVEFLLHQLQHYLQQHPEIESIVAVFSMLADKDIAGVTQLLSKYVKQWYIAPLAVPRAAPLARLQTILCFGGHVHSFADVSQAFTAAIQQSHTRQLILVCGSFHTLEAVWEYLQHGDEQ